jgi:hypothetical protein
MQQRSVVSGELKRFDVWKMDGVVVTVVVGIASAGCCFLFLHVMLK